MKIPAFDYDAYWRDATRDDWRQEQLHWHCHLSRMDGAVYGDEPARRDSATEYAPKVIRDWLHKPAHTIRATPATPEEAIQWLRQQWDAIKPLPGEINWIPEETRLGIALYDLRCGNDVCWGFWLGSSAHLHLAIVGTNRACH